MVASIDQSDTKWFQFVCRGRDCAVATVLRIGFIAASFVLAVLSTILSAGTMVDTYRDVLHVAVGSRLFSGSFGSGN